MPNVPSANPTPITPPRVPLIDERTGLIDRSWYMFFLSLFRAAQNADDALLGPSTLSLVTSLEAALDALSNQVVGSPSSQVGELQQQINTLRQEIQTLPRPALGSMAQLQQDNVPWLEFDTTPESVPTSVGTVAWDGGSTLGVQATANVVIRVGESEYVYVKASSAITKGQLCYHTGAVGSSGVITAAPTPLALADPNQIVGVAAETIALNAFGLIQISGDLRGFNTTGSSVGETWADGDPLYYNPAYVGSFTKTKPSAPNQKTYIGEVTNAGSGASGSIHIRIVPGSILGGTDSNVQFGTLANNDLIQYDSALGYWKNVPATTVGVTTFSAGTTGLTPSAPTSGAVTLGGTLATTNGGTGVTTTPANGQLLIGNGTGYTVANLTAGSGVSISNSAGGISISATGTGGTVTSVGLSMPSQFTVTNSPVTTTGTLTAAWNTQTANYVLAGPTTGVAATPTFRALVAGDIPSLSYVTSVGATAPITSTGGLTPTIGVTAAALTKTDDTNVTLTLGGSPTTALLAATSLTLGWTGQLSASRGGTGIGTYAVGDILYASATGTLTKLAIGTAYQQLGVNAGATAPAWQPSATSVLTTQGDLLYASAANTLARLAKNTTATRYLANTGTSNNPNWDQVNLTNGVTGTLPVGSGGTGIATLTANYIPYGNGTSAFQSSANLTFDGTSLKVGSKTVPTLTGGQAQLIGDCIIFAGDTTIGSPYTQNLQIDITWGNWGSNPAFALVEVAIAAREFGGTSGGAFGWLYATNGGGATFNAFTTTGVTTSQGTLTAASGGNYILRITFDPTSQTDRIGYTIRIPTMAGGTGSTVSSISATLV